MDFGTLLHMAKKNSETSKNEGKYYSTKFAPPKKESKESKRLSENIQRFLAKQEQEEKERQRQEKEKVQRLLAMRDEKSKNKIRKMLKVTKSANKSVLDDVADSNHTAITLNGDDQPDQDDYGYVSTEANAFYQRYLEKVKDVKEDKGFTQSRPQSVKDLSGTKERVKAAIHKEVEEKGKHGRQRISAIPSKDSSSSIARAYSTSKPLYDPEAERRDEDRKRQEEKEKKIKNRRPPPPPMDFQALLKLAEKKQHEPIQLVVETVKKNKKEPERLLTSKEKRELEERQRAKEERDRRLREPPGAANSSKDRKPESISTNSSNGARPPLNKAIPSGSSSTGKSSSSSPAVAGAGNTATKSSISSVGDARKSGNAKSGSTSSVKQSSVSSKQPSSSIPSASVPKPSSSTSVLSKNSGNKPSREFPQRDLKQVKSRPFPPSDVQKTRPFPPSDVQKTRPFPPADVQKTRPFPPADVQKTRPFPPADVQRTRQFPPADVQRTRQFPPPDVRRRPGGAGGDRKPQQINKRRIYDDDDEDEYDSEMDDFIDDGDAEEDYSTHIKAIFGYDKSRYRDLDEEDDAAMESNFAQVQREEFISKKIGIQEDLEDMRMEAMEKKRKMAKKRRLVD